MVGTGRGEVFLGKHLLLMEAAGECDRDVLSWGELNARAESASTSVAIGVMSTVYVDYTCFAGGRLAWACYGGNDVLVE